MEIIKLLEQYKSGYNDLQNALRDFPPEMWDYKPSSDRWSIKEIIVHITDSEINGYLRFRKAIAENGSGITAYDQNAWAETLQYSSKSMDTNTELFRLIRALNYSLLAGLSEAAWENYIMHPEIGKLTLKGLLDIYVEHVPAHIIQMKKVFDDWHRTKT